MSKVPEQSEPEFSSSRSASTSKGENPLFKLIKHKGHERHRHRFPIRRNSIKGLF